MKLKQTQNQTQNQTQQTDELASVTSLVQVQWVACIAGKSN